MGKIKRKYYQLNAHLRSFNRKLFGFSEPKKIDFIICGTVKAGTSSIGKYLRLHSGIEMPAKKELKFFNNDVFFAKKSVDYGLLHGHFKFHDAKTIRGEATPDYMFWQSSIQRIWDYNPKIKLILILRNPVDRAFSHWNMQVHRKLETLDFIEAINHETIRKEQMPLIEFKQFAYVNRGFYARQLKHILSIFPKEQVLCIKYEDYKANQKESLYTILEYLQVKNPDMEIYNERIDDNIIPYRSKLHIENRAKTISLLKEDILELENILGWDCSDWKSIVSSKI